MTKKDQERNPEDLTIEDEMELKKRRKRYEAMDSAALLEEVQKQMNGSSAYEREEDLDTVDVDEKDLEADEEAEDLVADDLDKWDPVD